MANFNNLQYWLMEAESGPQDSPPDAMGPGTTTPGFGDVSGANPSVAKPTTEEPEQKPSDDPQAPDTDISDDSDDFDTWQSNYFELSIKGDSNELLDALGQVTDRQLDSKQRRFVSDNTQVVILSQDANFNKASKEIRKLISQELDRNNPSVSLLQHIHNNLEAYPVLSNIFIKLAGQGGLKSELHRKFIAALLGAVETGGGPGSDKADVTYVAQDYTIDISTRFTTTWSEVAIGKWTLQEDDVDRYLSDPEVERLTDKGSPEEKRVLRRRVCMESIAQKFSKRAFLIHHVNPQDGQITALGLDLAELMREGYQEGKLVVRKNKSNSREAMIDDNGEIIPLFSYSMLYRKENDDMESKSEEVPFIEQRGGMLFLAAEPETLQEVAGGMPGIFYQAYPYNGNPSDLPAILRCFPSVTELLLRRC